MTAARRCLALALWICGGCTADDEPGDDATTRATTIALPTREDPIPGDPCPPDSEARCGEDGDSLYLCTDGTWTAQTCTYRCRQLAPPQCSLGCIIAADGEDCLCLASELPC